MKKIYMIPLLRLTNVSENYQICAVSGVLGEGSGTSEGEEDMTKDRQPKGDDSWGNLW